MLFKLSGFQKSDENFYFQESGEIAKVVAGKYVLSSTEKRHKASPTIYFQYRKLYNPHSERTFYLYNGYIGKKHVV